MEKKTHVTKMAFLESNDPKHSAVLAEMLVPRKQDLCSAMAF